MEGLIQSSVVKDQEITGNKYSRYFDWQEPVKLIPGHRLLACCGVKNEGFLKLNIRPPKEKALALLCRRFVKNNNDCATQVVTAIDDCYTRLLGPSIETDIRQQAKERADDEALGVFARNLRETLMAPPLGPKIVLAIDPGYRTAARWSVWTRRANIWLMRSFIPASPKPRSQEAGRIVRGLVQRFEVEAIAIGNGTPAGKLRNSCGVSTWAKKYP